MFVLSAPLDGTMSRVDVEPGDQVQVGENRYLHDPSPCCLRFCPRARPRSSSRMYLPPKQPSPPRAPTPNACAPSTTASNAILIVRKKLLVSATISQQAVDNAEAAEREGYLALRSSEAVIGVRRQQLAAARAALMPSETPKR